MHIYYQQNQTSSTNNSINGNSQSLQYAQEQPNVANLPSSCSAHTLSVSALPPQQPESQSLVQQYVQTPYYNSPDYNTNHVSSSTFSVANTSITPYVPSGVAANTTTTTTCTIISSYPTLDNHLGGTTSDLSSMSSLQASPQHYETVAQAPSSQYDSTSTTIMMTNGSHSNYVTPIPDCDSLHTVETKLERLHLQSEPSHLQSHQPSSFVASTFSNDPAVNVSSYYAQN